MSHSTASPRDHAEGAQSCSSTVVMLGSGYQPVPALSMLKPLGSMRTGVPQVGLTSPLHPEPKLPREELVWKGYNKATSSGTDPSWTRRLRVRRNHPSRQRSPGHVAEKMPGSWQGWEPN